MAELAWRAAVGELSFAVARFGRVALLGDKRGGG